MSLQTLLSSPVYRVGSFSGGEKICRGAPYFFQMRKSRRTNEDRGEVVARHGLGVKPLPP